MATASVKNILWQQVWQAVDNVRDRLNRATKLLDGSGVSYAVIGGNAVATWVRSVDPSAVRFTQDVDLLIRRSDLDAARAALEPGGFVYRHSAAIDMFLDGPDAGAHDALHIVFAGEKVRQDYDLPAPIVEESERGAEFQILSLEPLVRMKLTSNRDKDRTHIRDLIGVGLVDASWPDRLPPVLAERLQAILANPDG